MKKFTNWLETEITNVIIIISELLTFQYGNQQRFTFDSSILNQKIWQFQPNMRIFC